MDGNLGFINNQIWMKIRENMDGFVLFDFDLRPITPLAKISDGPFPIPSLLFDE